MRSSRNSLARFSDSGLLLLVIEGAADRVMGVVRLDDQIGDGELDLVGPQLSGFRLRRQPEAFAEIEQDIGRLADDPLAIAQEGRGEGGRGDVRAVPQAHQFAGAALARHVDIVGAGLLQRQSDEFAAPLDARPVVQLVGHAGSLLFRSAGQHRSVPGDKCME